MAISIIDVARKAKVSRATVTRVMGGADSVAADTRRAVLTAIRELGYVPSAAARAMRSKDRLRTSEALCFALIFGPDTAVDDGFFCDIARGSEEAAAKAGLCPLQVHWQTTFEKSWPRMQSVFAIGGLCGAVLVGQFAAAEVRTIRDHARHVVMVDGPAPADVAVGSVEADNVAGCRMALEHLYDRGCRRVLMLRGPDGHYFAEAMAAAAAPLARKFRQLDVRTTDYTAGAAETAVRQAFARQRYDGIFGNDESALGAIRALADLKINVPDTTRVIGFDDIPHAAHACPRLSTVAIDKRQLGREAVAALVEMVRGNKNVETTRKIIRAKLVVREST